MQEKNEKQLLFIIRYTFPLLVLILSIGTSIFLYLNNQANYNKQKEHTKQELITQQKELIKTQIENLHKYIIFEQKETKENLKKTLRDKIYKAHEIILNIYMQYKHTHSKEEITKIIKTAIRPMRFNKGRGYFFIYDMEGRSILHPISPQKEGKSFINEKENSDRYLQKEAISLLNKSNEVYLKYFFEMPNNKKEESLKLSYLKKFEPFNWYIGTGEYLEDFAKDIQKQVLFQIDKFRFGKNGYFFILDSNDTYLSHFQKDLVGKNALVLRNINNTKQILKNMKESDGYVEYLQKINTLSEFPEEKVVYSKIIPNWNWVLATGFYISDANKLIKERQKSIEEEHTRNIQNHIFISILITTILFILSFFISKRIKNIFLEYKTAVEEKKEELLNSNIELKEQKNLIELIINSIPDIVFVKNRSGIYLHCNKKFEKFYNTPLKEIIGKTDYHFVDKELADFFKEHDKKAMKAETPLSNYEKLTFLDDGHEEYIQMLKTAIKDEKGKTIGVLGIGRDLTKEKEQNKKLLEQSKMASLGEMLGNIAHQWRQPLSVITTSASGLQLQQDMDLLNEKDIVKYTNTIMKQSKYLSETIEIFSNFIRNDKKKLDVSIQDEINKTLSLMKATLKSKFINLDIEIEETPFVLNMIKGELSQVLINILNNAKDVLLEKNIPNPYIKLKLAKNNHNKITISVEDNAGGIDKDILQHVFEPYFTTKHQSIGTGLGLYIAYKIVTESLNGDLYAVNTDIGAKFIIEL